MKAYDIEVQRLKSMRHDKGLIEVDIDALVMIGRSLLGIDDSVLTRLSGGLTERVRMLAG